MKRILSLAATLLVFSSLAGSPRPAAAAASHANCTGFIDAVGTVVSTSGTWCVRHDLVTSGEGAHAVVIEAHDVVIDCGEHSIRFEGTPSTDRDGIRGADRHNVTVRNCRVSGFRRGIALYGSAALTHGHLVEDNVVTHATNAGIQVHGDGSMVRRNRVAHGTGTTNGSAYGIYSSYSVDIEENTIEDLSADTNGTVQGILVADAKGNSVRGNRVRGLSGEMGLYGILMQTAFLLTVSGNELINDGPVPGSMGVHCDFSGDHLGRVGDNVISGFATPMENTCTDLGDNDITP